MSPKWVQHRGQNVIKTLPENNRILITSHDAFQYYGRRYGLRLESVLGTSTDADVQITDINNLVAVIDKFSVPAMFVESTINPKLLEQLAEDRGIIIGGKLFADSLGDEESGADTYIDMIRQNTKRLLLGLSGKAANQTTAKTELWIFLIVIVLLFAASFIVVATKLKTPQNKMGNRRDYSLTIEGLSVSYDRKTVLTNIYLNLQPGKIYGLIGPNGAGKSTLFKAILNLISIDAGKIEVNGHSLDSLRKYIAYIPQKEEIDWQFPATVSDIVSMGRYPHKDTFERLSNDDWKIVEEMMEKTGITELRYRQIGELSGGQQQRVFLARALSQHAEIYLFDEPFVGVDATTETKMMEILRDLASEGKLILVIHHDLSKVEEYFDSVIMLNQRLVAFGPVAETFTDEIIKKTYSGKLTILQHMEEIV
ncbi:MAG TPA: ATP-binding cassette domain-containing protein [Candidatus Lambdaproteobacteria bacterium]|nr:ATP-binding cassette domain-containing protein [Candidatus Lambdaproteobacteria bacterium]